jgi:hypothetical protein
MAFHVLRVRTNFVRVATSNHISIYGIHTILKSACGNIISKSACGISEFFEPNNIWPENGTVWDKLIKKTAVQKNYIRNLFNLA